MWEGGGASLPDGDTCFVSYRIFNGLKPSGCAYLRHLQFLLHLRQAPDLSADVAQVLPFFQFYRGAEGRVAAFSASVSKVQRLRDALAEHSAPRCSLGNESPGLEDLETLLASSAAAAGVCSSAQDHVVAGVQTPSWL